ncbi:MAG: hypothetical protein ACTSY1_01215 [Alphaproteobacteria bacterium]
MPDWVAVEAGYRDGALTVGEVCRRHGVSQRALYRRARKYAWPLRRGEAETGPPAPCKSPGATSHKPTSRQLLISRLFKTLETQMQSIEHRLNGQSGAVASSAADRERDARTLSALVRTMEKLCELESAAGPELQVAKAAQKNVEKDPARFERDIEDLRQALARRIAGFTSSRDD